jgi:hypothetical protein
MIPGIPDAAITPLGAVIFILIVLVLIVVFGIMVPRWVVTRLVTQANKRADDYERLYQIERARGDVMVEMASKVTTIAETSARILEAIPRMGDTQTEKVPS